MAGPAPARGDDRSRRARTAGPGPRRTPAPPATPTARRSSGCSAVRGDVRALAGVVGSQVGVAAHLGRVHLVGLAVAGGGAVALLLGGEGVGLRVPAPVAVLGSLDQLLLGLLETLGLALSGLLERPPLLFPPRFEIAFFHGLSSLVAPHGIAESRGVYPPRMVEGVHRFGDGFVNWYLVEGDGGLTAVDAGLRNAWRTLVGALEGLGRPMSDLRAVVLTHGHIDHVGFARRAQKEAGATVYVHEADAPLIRSPFNVARSARGPLRYFNHKQARALLFHSIAAGAPLNQRIRDYRTFAPGVPVPVPGNPVPVFSPGHTDGHCAMHLPDRDVLISGDALVTYEPYTGRTGPSIVAAAATKDPEQALRS